MQLIFTPDDSGTNRGSGYATVEYSSSAENETIVETTEDELASIFEAAKSDGGTLDGADESIDAAIEDPLAFVDFLLLDANRNGEFNDGYVRETGDESTSS